MINYSSQCALHLCVPSFLVWGKMYNFRNQLGGKETSC